MSWKEKRCGAFLLRRVQTGGEGGTEAAEGCSKWIFLVCNEATFSADAGACGVFRGSDGEKNVEQYRARRG